MKRELRQQLREILRSIPPDDIRQKSAHACALLIEQPEFRKAEVVMVFLSLPTEINTTALVLRAWQDRKRVLAPKVSWEQRRMIPIEIRSLAENMSETEFGIREPTVGMPFPVEEIDLVIVPGLGYDALGNRLGRGRGFYDRFLAQEGFHGVACGFAFEEQIVNDIPADGHDMQVDILVTDKAVRRFGM